MSSPKIKYRPDIDGLRAIAISIVVLYHAHLGPFQGGFIGVDVFFVLSGFLITQLLSQELTDTGTINFWNFYARRVIRLFPAMVVTTLVTILVWTFFYLGVADDTWLFIKSVITGQVGFANMLFYKSTQGYFHSSSDEMPFLHYWSLSVEEQFYLFWPLMMWFSGKKLIDLKISKNPKRLIIISLVSIILISFVGTLYFTSKGNIRTPFYLMPLRAWELGFGAILVFVLPHLKMSSAWLRTIFSIIGISFILYAAIAFDSTTIFPGLNALLPTIGTVLLIIAGANISEAKEGGFITQALSAKPMVSVGQLSYSWYLWHWPFLAFSKISYHGANAPLSVRITIVAISIVFAWLSLHYIENPFRNGSWIKKIGGRKVVFNGITTSAVVITAAFVPFVVEKQFVLPNWQEEIRQTTERSGFDAKCADQPGKLGTPDCLVSNKGRGIASETTQKVLFVWGDSHSVSLFPMIEDYVQQQASENKIDSYLFSNFGIPPFAKVGGLQVKSPKDHEYSIGRNSAALESMKTKISENPQAEYSVFYAFRIMTYLGKPGISHYSTPFYLEPQKNEEATQKMFEKAFRTTMSKLKSIGIKKILVMLPYPEFPAKSLRCLQLSPEECFVTRKQFLDYSHRVRVFLQTVASEDSSIKLLDPVEKLCDEKKCDQMMMINGKKIIATFDDNHKSVEAARYLASQSKSELDWVTSSK